MSTDAVQISTCPDPYRAFNIALADGVVRAAGS
jgi:hypothetical protein